MAQLILYGVSLLALFLCTTAQAPGDADRKCVDPHPVLDFRITKPIYEPTQHVLVASRHYETLFGSSGVWTSIESDSNGGKWAHGLGSICNFQVRSCSNRRAQPQENYLITQHIDKFHSQQIIIEFDYRFSGSRYVKAFDVLVYETLGYDHLGAVNKDNYRLIERIQTNSRRGHASILFVPDVTKNGFYLAFRENGTCLTLSEIVVYAFKCPKQELGLISFPETFAPPQGSGNATETYGKCMEYSSTSDGGTSRANQTHLQCAAFGRWLQAEDCECNPGYKRIDDQESQSRCEGCPSSTYKSHHSNTADCHQCPQNSDSEVGASECPCNYGYYRAEHEDYHYDCTAPPSAPHSCNVSETQGTSLTVEWDVPLYNGGRSDGYFAVYYQEASKLHQGFKRAGETSGLNFTIKELKPVTEYVVRIVAENGVSSQAYFVELRTCETSGNTTEGVPEKITLFARKRHSTFTWQPPAVTNGAMTGFCFRTYCKGHEDEAILIELDNLEFCYSPESSKLPSAENGKECDCILAQVQAKTKKGGGEWSDPMRLRPEHCQCLSLEEPENGKVEINSEVRQATYECDSGFVLSGEKERSCREDGTWSGEEPSCVEETLCIKEGDC